MRFARGIVLLVTALTIAGPAVADSHLEDPSERIRSTAVRILNALNENHAEYSRDPSLLADIVRRDLLPLLDLNYSARLILGRAGRSATPGQIDAFAIVMGDLLADRYSIGLLEFRSEEQLQVLPVKGDLNHKMTRVRSRVRLNNGGMAPVDYVCRMTDEGWKIFDIIVEGISYVTTYRSQIIPEVEAEGLDAVIERLRTGELEFKG